LVAQVRDELLARAKQEKREARTVRSAKDCAKQLREVERELENIKQAIRQGIVTPTTKAMLENAERRYKALQGGHDVSQPQSDMLVRLEARPAGPPGAGAGLPGDVPCAAARRPRAGRFSPAWTPKS